MTTKSAFVFFVTGVTCSAVVVATLIYCARTFGPLPLSVSQTTTQKQGTFDVTGESVITVVPDNAQVTLGIDVTKPKVAEAQIEVNRVMNDLTARLKTMSIDAKDIKTENYTVYPNYDYANGSRKANGYRVSSSIQVNLKQFDKVNDVIDAATAIGVTEVSGVNFTLSDEKEAQVKQQARKEAIDKAKKNAADLSSLAGMKLGKIVNVSEDTPQRPMMYDMAKAALPLSGGGAAPTQIEPGSSQYSYSVTLSYETL